MHWLPLRGPPAGLAVVTQWGYQATSAGVHCFHSVLAVKMTVPLSSRQLSQPLRWKTWIATFKLQSEFTTAQAAQGLCDWLNCLAVLYVTGVCDVAEFRLYFSRPSQQTAGGCWGIRILAGDVWGGTHDFADFLKSGSMVVADVPDMQQLDALKQKRAASVSS